MLTLGTILYLKEGTEKLMIINRQVLIEVNNEQLLFDYSGCIYPQGANENNIYYFNEENIDKIVFEGYKDSDEDRFQELFDEWEKTNNNNFKKGNVEELIRANKHIEK